MSAARVSDPSSGPPPTAFTRLPRLAQLSVAALAVCVAALSVQLWPEWRHNPDLSHGLFMPVIFLLLLHESRSAGAPRWLSAGRGFNTTFGGALLGGLLALVAAGLYAAALAWSHALVSFSLTFSLVLLLTAGLLAFASASVRFVPFNWSSVVALVLWLPCAPIPPGTYMRLTLGLQLWVSENVLRALHLLGIAAARHGNVIELAHGSVGIEEACSGVRSLISCVFAGFFFSATLVRRPSSRALLVALSAPLALGMNFLRSLALSLLANRGTNIAGAWHDVTGFAVLAVTAGLLGGLALLLEHREKSPAPVAAAPAVPTEAQPSTLSAQLRFLAAGLALAVALLIGFTLNTRPSDRRDAPVPDLLAVLPASAEGWRVETSTDLYQFRDTLQTENLAQRTYVKTTPAGEEVRIVLYLAYWRPGQSSVSQVASHTPDACWPGSGWDALPVAQPRAQPVVAGRALATAEYRSFRREDFPQHVWFWHLYDGRPISYRDPYSASELLRIAWRYGFRHNGDQLFVRASSNLPLAEIVNEPLLAQFFARTQPLGS
ncbi:MAG: exosortase/archaeosortase family protein [Opitutus sp.]|nr:exosortase/archaeosortase family protein [Opitutus sp.]